MLSDLYSTLTAPFSSSPSKPAKGKAASGKGKGEGTGKGKAAAEEEPKELRTVIGIQLPANTTQAQDVIDQLEASDYM